MFENPWLPATWSVTQQGDYVRQFGIDMARKRAAEAGTTVGGKMVTPKRPIQQTFITRRTSTQPTVIDFGTPPNDTTKTNFWTNIDDNNGTPRIWRMRERVFVGDAVTFTGSRASASGAWLDDDTGANWAIRDAQLGVMHSRGSLAIVGYSRSSDADDLGSAAAIGVSGLVINDSNKTKAAWGLYSDVILTNPQGTVYGVEFATKNASGVNQTASPYHAVAGTVGIWLPAGGDDTYGPVSNAPCNSAIQIGGFPGEFGTWNKGIVFYDRLTRDDTFGRAAAIEMCRYHEVNWFKPDNTHGFQITSGVNTGESGSTIMALNNGVYFLNASGQVISTFYNDVTNTAANYFSIRPGVAAGTPPRLLAQGSSTDIDIWIAAKGAGTIRFGTVGAANGAATITGTVKVKDDAGNVYYLATTQAP